MSIRQFEEMRERLAGRRKASFAMEKPAQATARTHSMILGIDPSLRGTGYGVIRVARAVPQAVAQGVVRCPAVWERSMCLATISREIREVLRRWEPTVCVFEGLFHARNLRTAIIMGEARGASLAAASEAGVEVYEMAPRRVKQAIVGYGAADKLAVAKMVQRRLGLAETPAADAADALALALAYSQEQGHYALRGLKRL